MECRHEIIALNIMTILKRTGDEFRDLSWDEYTLEREKDGKLSIDEQSYFDRVKPYTLSAEIAQTFSSSWKPAEQ